MRLGAQVSAAGGLALAVERAVGMGAEVAQTFAHSPRAWRQTVHDPAVLETIAQEASVPLYLHAAYLINLCSTDETLWTRSLHSLRWHLAIARDCGARGVVLHPGSHKGAGAAAGMAALAEGVRRAIDGIDGTQLLLENAAGSGDTIGKTFDQLAEVIAACDNDPRLGVCLDTQHLWASGVDYSTKSQADQVVAEVESTVGLERLGLVHLNDSKVDLGSNRDRHENLGDGTIGSGPLGLLVSHPGLEGKPAVLEVPGPEKKGPCEHDLDAARKLLAQGRLARSGT